MGAWCWLQCTNIQPVAAQQHRLRGVQDGS